jgi:hypothetical protein
LRRVLRLTESTIDKHGNPLLIPHDVLDGWTTRLPAHITAAQVIELYCCQPATHEPFHAKL